MNFTNKKFAPYSDEMSGVGGKYRPTTYGVYDNHNNRIYYIDGWEATSWEDARDKAIELNKVHEAENLLKS